MQAAVGLRAQLHVLHTEGAAAHGVCGLAFFLLVPSSQRQLVRTGQSGPGACALMRTHTQAHAPPAAQGSSSGHRRPHSCPSSWVSDESLSRTAARTAWDPPCRWRRYTARGRFFISRDSSRPGTERGPGPRPLLSASYSVLPPVFLALNRRAKKPFTLLLIRGAAHPQPPRSQGPWGPLPSAPLLGGVGDWEQSLNSVTSP